jgi:glycosyltransferase involved in cell wall biosynthesis
MMTSMARVRPVLARGERKLLAIIPAYNEEATVSQVLEDVRRNAPQLDLLVIDDGSSDSTFERASAAGAIVLRHPFNLGLGAAVHTAYKYACEHGYTGTVQVDGDGQHDASQIRQLLAVKDAHVEAEIVSGSRFVEKSTDGYRGSIRRRGGIKVFGSLLSLVLRQRVTDPTSGFRLVSGRALWLLAADRPHVDHAGWGGDVVETILMVHVNRLRWYEVPVKMRSRGGGSSSISSRWLIYYSLAKLSLAVFVGLLRRRAPVEESTQSVKLSAESQTS